MADDVRTLILKVQADVETAREQMKGLAADITRSGSQIDAKLSDIEKKFEGAGKGISTKATVLATAIGSGIGTVLGQATGSIISFLQEAAAQTFETADTLSKLADATGLSTDELQNFRYAADQAGLSTDRADNALQRYVETTGKAASGNAAARKAFDDIGVSLKDANGNLKPLDQLLREVFDGISKLPDPSRQAAAATKIFGDAGKELAPVLADGAKGYDELAAAADNLGIKLSDDTIRKMADLKDEAEDVGKVITAELAADIARNADAILYLLNAVNGGVDGLGQFVRYIRDVVDGFNAMDGSLTDRILRFFVSTDELAERGQSARFVREIVGNTDLGANSIRPERERPAGASGGRVVDPPERPARAARRARSGSVPIYDQFTPAQLRAGYADKIGDTERAGLGIDGVADELSAQLTADLPRVRQQLVDTFDPSILNDFSVEIPELTDRFDFLRDAAAGFGEDLAAGLSDAIIRGRSLADVFSNIGQNFLQFALNRVFNSLFGGIFDGIFGGFFADGGSPPVGRPIVVGERGREVFVPRVPGDIIPNHMLGGGQTIIYQTNVTGSILTEELYRDIQRGDSRAAQTGVMGGRSLTKSDQKRDARRRIPGT